MDVEGVVIHCVGPWVLDGEAEVDDSLSIDLGLDSIDLIEIGMEVEDYLGVNIPDSEMNKWTFVRDIVKTVNKQLEEV